MTNPRRGFEGNALAISFGGRSSSKSFFASGFFSKKEEGGLLRRAVSERGGLCSDAAQAVLEAADDRGIRSLMAMDGHYPLRRPGRPPDGAGARSKRGIF